jgi:hypothetical protein
MNKGLTPKGIVMNLSKNNPILNNLINMAEKGDNQGVETFARNLLKDKGLDFDNEMHKLKSTLKIQ